MTPYRFYSAVIRLLALAALSLSIGQGCSRSGDGDPDGVEGAWDERSKKEAGSQEFFQAKTVLQRTLESTAGLLRPAGVASFYRVRDHRPYWTGKVDRKGLVEELFDFLEALPEHGLDPLTYRFHELTEAWAALEPFERPWLEAPGGAARLELMLTDAWLHLGGHLLNGRASWPAIAREGEIALEKVAWDSLLEVAAGTSVRKALATLLPRDAQYLRLQASLRSLKEIHSQGGHPKVVQGEALQVGDSSSRVHGLCRALASHGYELSSKCDSAFDPNLEALIRRFQGLHGLKVDGIVGAEVYDALNAPVTESIRKVELSLERMRWLPRDLGSPYILVNVPDYGLELSNGNQASLGMRVAVGLDSLQTPSFSDTMTKIVLNPYWHVPKSIVKNELMRHFVEDPDYIRARGYEIVPRSKAQDAEYPPFDPDTLAWDSLASMQDFPYHVRQKPGAKNAMGRIKFLFPNRFSVYLHDTPDASVFDKRLRDISHGCIRVEKPEELAERLLAAGSDEWDGRRMREALQSEKQVEIDLDRPVPVHIVYFTAWVGREGRLQLRSDVYGRDAALAQKFGQGPEPMPMAQ